MSDYPRIYSISTVGVRQHGNTDYLIHPLRTDFTGDNGLGKSIIADLLQLIFIPKRDLWKPGTEGINHAERKIETIPLTGQRQAYSFLNIEKKKGQFLVIGVYIPNTGKQVSSFIIQRNPDFAEELIPFEKPLLASDFTGDDNRIFTLEDLKKDLLNKQLFCKSYFTSDISSYHNILFRNKLIPIDLSREANLVSYAKVIQSFSRAKSLDINKSKSLKDFLFEDNLELKENYLKEKDNLEEYIKNYRKQQRLVRELQQKQVRLNELKVLHEQYRGAVDSYYRTRYFKTKSELTRKNAEKEQTGKILAGLESALQNAQNLILENKTLAVQTLMEDKQALTRAASVIKSLLNDVSEEQIGALKKTRDEMSDLVNRLRRVIPVIEKYGSARKVIDICTEQIRVREDIKKIRTIMALEHFKLFENSTWCQDFEKATDEYFSGRNERNIEISSLEEQIRFLEGSSEGTFFKWAVERAQTLSEEEETVLMGFKGMVVSKPAKPVNNSSYIVNPEKLLSDYTREEKGVWVNKGQIRTFLPVINERRFSDPKLLERALRSDIEVLKKHLAFIREKQETEQALYKELCDIQANSSFIEAWKNKEYLFSFSFDEEVYDQIIYNIRELEGKVSVASAIFDEYSSLSEQISKMEKESGKLIQLEQTIKAESEKLQKLIDEEKKEETKLEEKALPALSVWDLEELINTHSALNEEYASKRKALADGKQRCSQFDAQLKGSEGKMKELINEAVQLDEQLQRRLQELKENTNMTIDGSEQNESEQIEDELLERLQQEMDLQKTKYQTEFTRIAQTFSETKDDQSIELKTDVFNFYTLVKILCGDFGLEGITDKLEEINSSLVTFGDLQLRIIQDVFSQVEKQYLDYRSQINNLNFFFRDNQISNHYQFKIEFLENKEITIDWIDKMRERAKTVNQGRDLFSQDLPESELTPDALIVKIAEQFSKVKNCEISDLLNPKFYFNLQVALLDNNNVKYTGSGGQAYTAIALLCIGRLSVIQRDKRRDGVKFIIIEELSNIDEINFSRFPEIAQQFGYQLITMTPKPFGVYTGKEWYLHMLIRGKEDKDLNYPPLSWFRKNGEDILLDGMG